MIADRYQAGKDLKHELEQELVSFVKDRMLLLREAAPIAFAEWADGKIGNDDLVATAIKLLKQG